MGRSSKQGSSKLGPAFWTTVLLSVLAMSFAGCNCDGSATSSGDAGSSGAGGTGGSVPSDLKAVIKATPPAIPRGDNFATQVTLDGSESGGGDGPLTYKWDVGQGKIVSGKTSSAQIVATFEGL